MGARYKGKVEAVKYNCPFSSRFRLPASALYLLPKRISNTLNRLDEKIPIAR
jgi:hypothetical protein